VAVNKPYRRTCRQFLDGTYSRFRHQGYILHPKFALSPEHYVRAFLILLKDVHELFDYIEPADGNLACFSFRIHALLLHACVEVEANCKAILVENGYTKSTDMNMGDYKKIEKTHFLSSYEVTIPNWRGTQTKRTPFSGWSTGGSLAWYQAYNATKHDRHSEFEQASFKQLIDATCGLFVLLSAQFHATDFSHFGTVLTADDGPRDGTAVGIGGYFLVRFPDNMPSEDRYDFDWDLLKGDADPFQNLDYRSIV
jgi:hypothetical protein